jgi:excisionase family DNA binding protein
MAKPFYTIEEVCQKLGKSQEEIRAMVREGRLREFRDAGKIFFKAEDVDRLGRGAGPSADSGEITLEPVDERLPSLSEVASSGGTSVIGLEPLEEEAPSPPAPPAAQKKKEGTAITSAGIGVFDEDELEIDVDPMAKTQITAAAPTDQLTLEGTGSGSGLLDLTREADDTSLGAELLDEIYPGEEEVAVAPPKRRAVEEPAAAPEPIEEAVAAGATAEAPPQMVPGYAPAGDPTEGLFTGLMVGGLILLAVGGSVVAGVLQGFTPDYARFLSNNFLIFLGGSVLVTIVAMLVGWLAGRASSPPRG